jgi:hypothetical protein
LGEISEYSPYIYMSIRKKKKKKKEGKNWKGEEKNWVKSQNTLILCPYIVYEFRSIILAGLGPRLS